MKLGMQYMIAALLALTTLCGCSGLSDEELSPSDISLEELEKRMAEATDPHGRFAKAKSFILKQEVETKRFLDTPIVQMVETKIMQPDYFKITTYSDNQPASALISNGTSSWVVDYENRKVKMVDPDKLGQVKKFSDITSPGSRFSRIFSNVTVQKCRIGDKLYYKLVCPGDDGNVLNAYVDAETCQTVRISIVKKGEVVYDSSLMGYGLYEGVRIPEKTSVRSGGVEKVSTVLRCKLNPAIDISEFRPPVF